jgi:hypothetical protein
MSLSSNTLIHFTDSADNLKGILTSNFKLSYCKECTVIGGKKSEFHVPMVSFCDIPLSQIKEHISKYGDYGIGMTRSWARKNGLNPVLYMDKSSRLSSSYRTALKYFSSSAAKAGTATLDDDHKNAVIALADILGYVKNYEGDLVRKGQSTQNYRFSDEREWRYVPASSAKQLWLVPSKTYKEAGREEKAKSLAEQHLLEFEPNDIKYIIIRNDSEIGDFIEHLRHAKRKYIHEDVERLTTRILTTEQIRDDI